MLVEEGDGDGDEDGDGVEVDEPPITPPLPQWLLKALGPQSTTARKAGPIPLLAEVLEQGCTGDETSFFLPRA